MSYFYIEYMYSAEIPYKHSNKFQASWLKFINGRTYQIIFWVTAKRTDDLEADIIVNIGLGVRDNFQIDIYKSLDSVAVIIEQYSVNLLKE